DEYDITVRLPESERDSINDLTRLHVPTNTGEAIPLSSVGEFEYRPGLGTIHRIDLDRVVTLEADVEGRRGPAVLKDVQDRLAELPMPAGYNIEYAGEKEDQDETSAFLTRAGVLGILLIVGILVTQFNTLEVPLIIVSTVVLSTAGALMSLLVHELPFIIIMTGVGMISLAGVVVNNAIVLLDYTRQLQRKGRAVWDAAMEAGVTRLRPVLLTATTTILGLVPMATGISFDFRSFEWATRSESSQWWQTMALAVIYGLSFATLLTLVVVPSLYVMLYGVGEKLGLGGIKRPEEKDAEVVATAE
ncbi:MAG: efflux RND transporter permease subunit, partial [Planctomycetota bacterium]